MTANAKQNTTAKKAEEKVQDQEFTTNITNIYLEKNSLEHHQGEKEIINEETKETEIVETEYSTIKLLNGKQIFIDAEKFVKETKTGKLSVGIVREWEYTVLGMKLKVSGQEILDKHFKDLSFK